MPTPSDRVTRAWSAPSGDGAQAGDDQAADEIVADAAVLEVVAGLICELLDLPSVDHRDNFFLLGGHSMLGAQLIARLDELFAVELPLREVFQNPDGGRHCGSGRAGHGRGAGPALGRGRRAPRRRAPRVLRPSR